MSGFLGDYGRQVGASVAGQSIGAAEVASTSAGSSAASAAASTAVGVGLMIGSIIGGAIARRKAKKRAQQSLRQGQLSLQIATTPRRRIYGEARVEADLKYWVTHGDNQEFVSLVYLLAEHECQEIVDVQFDNVSIGPLDGNGDVQAGSAWYRSTPQAASANLASVAGTITLPTASAAMPSVAIARSYYPGYVPPFGTNDSGFVDLAPGVDFTHTVGSTSIVLAGDLAGVTIPANMVVVNYVTSTGVALARVRKYLGASVPQTADAALITDSGGEWTSTCRLDGQCYIVVRLRWDERIGAGRVPRVDCIVKGAKVYDPRTDSTAYSANWALCTADYVAHVTGCAYSEFVEADLEDSADTSDELVQAGPSKTVTAITKAAQAVATIPGHGFLPGDLLRFTVTGMTGINGHDVAIVSIVDASTVILDENTSGYGTFTAGTVIAKVPRYQLNGSVLSTQEPREVLEDMVLSAGGAVAFPAAGTIRVLCGKYRTPVSITLDDGDLAGPAMQFLPFPSDDEVFNVVSGKFFDARPVGGTRLYSETTYATYKSSAYIAEDGGDELPRSIDFPFTTDYRVANRVAKQIMHRSRQGARWIAPYKLRALPLQAGDVVELTHQRPGFDGKAFEIQAVAYAFPNQVILTVQETAAEAFDADYAEAAFVDPAPNTMLDDPTAVDQPILSVHASATDAPITIDTLADGSRVPYVLVSWPARTNASEFVSIRWKRSFETQYRTVEARPGETSVKLLGPSGGDVLQIIGYAINSINARSEPWIVNAFFVDDELPRYNGVLPALSANLVKNATLDVSTANWTPFGIGVASSAVVAARPTDPALRIAGSPSSIYLEITSTLTGNGYSGGLACANFAVEEGQVWCGYALLSPSATDALVRLAWFDAAGNLLGREPGNVVAAKIAPNWADPTAYELSAVTARAPTGARTGQLVVYGEGNWTAAARKNVSLHKPFAGVVPAGSVDVPVWSPGGSNVVDESTIKPGATRRLDGATVVLSGYIPALPKDTYVAVGQSATITGDFDGTGLTVLVTVSGNVEQLSDGTGRPIEVLGVITCTGTSAQESPARTLTYASSTPASPASQVTQKSGFEISHRFTLPAPLPGTGIRYAFGFKAAAPTGSVDSLVLFQNVVVTFDIAR